jgi:hypothetical protein
MPRPTAPFRSGFGKARSVLPVIGKFQSERIRTKSLDAYHRAIFRRSIERDFWRLSGMESCLVWLDTIPLAH